MSKFLVIFANIKNGDTVLLSAYFFTGGGTHYEKAERVILECDSPFSTDQKLIAEIAIGAEKRENLQHQTFSGTNENEGSITSLTRPPPRETSSDKPVTTFQPGFLVVSQEHSPTEREIALKKIYDQLKYWFGSQPESMFKFQTAKENPGSVEIIFRHYRKHWAVQFPQDFPNSPAKILSSAWEASLRFSECHSSDTVKPLNNLVNILLTIKNKCSPSCKVCKKFTREKLSQS